MIVDADFFILVTCVFLALNIVSLLIVFDECLLHLFDHG